ncbi:MAG: NADH-quinone oxidoreductase subunit J [Chloroflexota bacterium]
MDPVIAMVPAHFTPVEDAVFWVAAVSAVLSGIGVVAARSAIYSALSLIVTLGQLAVLYLLLNAQFIAAAQVLIYAGAVMVLFIFVITLLGVQEYPFLGRHLPGQRILSVFFGFLLLLGIVFFVAQSPHAITGYTSNFNQLLAKGNVGAFGEQLFTTFIFPFELTPLLLIVAMIGAVALGRRRRGGTEV